MFECNVGVIEEGGAVLARRVSGGGAVYHDEGNLNFAFFVDRKAYTRADLFEGVLRVLRELGKIAKK